MHRIRCFAGSAEGGFKINGPPEMGKGPMPNEENLKSSNEASPPQPTQAGRIETCQETIKEARRCLKNNDKECTMRKIEELIKANCHDGRLIGKEVANEVKELVHELWFDSSDEYRCELLAKLVEFGVSRNWIRSIFNTNTKMINKWITRCGIHDIARTSARRSDIVKKIEKLLREKFGWNEIRMCEELFKFIGVDVNEFRKYGIEPCIWLNGLKLLSDLKNPYWFGLRASDLAVEKHEKAIELNLKTTNTIDAVFFPMILNIIKTPRPEIMWGRIISGTRHVAKSIALSFCVDLGPNEWPWPIKINADELKKILDGFSDEEPAMFIAGLLDGDGSVWCIFDDNNVYAYVGITACKACPKRVILDVLKKVIVKRLNIVGSIKSQKAGSIFVINSKDTIRLLKLIRPYVHHPLRRLRVELILAYYEGRINLEAFRKLYEMTEYMLGAPDIKHNHGLETLARAAPQTHTHGVKQFLIQIRGI